MLNKNSCTHVLIKKRVFLGSGPSSPESLAVKHVTPYAPMWFSIKTSKYFIEGPKLVYQSIQSSRYLPDDLRNIVYPVIERNGFFAHPEHLMLALIQDNTKHIREFGLRRILKARQLDQNRTTIRTFMAPKLNFKARDYSEIINWMDWDLSSPSLLKDISDDEIKHIFKVSQFLIVI
ncbi:hypothetical protein AVEN_75941-1 [Araneus ventricosus]|uniref:Uncharacterized protein n=1 Tax=Araneus ventricosus TaxID=182803 RepID=A0A4Y2W0I5_ARAVE|nr:hypothetical protein AVEN_273044-1 [Araneus ventricosus]GBO32376.1 hypothetical protein AVEN_75941-1 [Araneus ventricosus]